MVEGLEGGAGGAVIVQSLRGVELADRVDRFVGDPAAGEEGLHLDRHRAHAAEAGRIEQPDASAHARVAVLVDDAAANGQGRRAEYEVDEVRPTRVATLEARGSAADLGGQDPRRVAHTLQIELEEAALVRVGGGIARRDERIGRGLAIGAQHATAQQLGVRARRSAQLDPDPVEAGGRRRPRAGQVTVQQHTQRGAADRGQVLQQEGAVRIGGRRPLLLERRVQPLFEPGFEVVRQSEHRARPFERPSPLVGDEAGEAQRRRGDDDGLEARVSLPGAAAHVRPTLLGDLDPRARGRRAQDEAAVRVGGGVELRLAHADAHSAQRQTLGIEGATADDRESGGFGCRARLAARQLHGSAFAGALFLGVRSASADGGGGRLRLVRLVERGDGQGEVALGARGAGLQEQRAGDQHGDGGEDFGVHQEASGRGRAGPGGQRRGGRRDPRQEHGDPGVAVPVVVGIEL